MQQASSLLILILTGILANAQSLTFTNTTINWNDEALILQSKIGESSNYTYILVENRTSYTVTAKVHTHSHQNFVWFTNSHGQHKNEVTISLPRNQSIQLPVFGYLQSGSTKVYNDDWGFDVYYGNSYAGYMEMDLTAYFYSGPKSGGSGNVGRATRPSGYDAWIPYGNTPMRPRTSDLPLKVYSNHSGYIRSDEFDKTMRRAVNLWNAAGQSIGLGKNIFVMTSYQSDADFVIDWSGRGLPAGALGVAKLAGCNSSQCYIDGITMRPPTTRNLGQTCETICQELGHLLGLGHSDYQNDIMNGTAHNHWHGDLSEVNLSDRDRQMLQWLFSLNNYLPLRPNR